MFTDCWMVDTWMIYEWMNGCMNKWNVLNNDRVYAKHTAYSAY